MCTRGGEAADMEYRNLGHTGLKVSPLCLGAMTFGDADEKSMMHQISCDEATSFAIMNRALDAGINFIDTADVYGQDGLSERVVGNWLEREKKREQLVLATKFRFRMAPGPNGTGASRYRIMQTAEASLRRLKTDRIDLYQIHMQDMDTPEEETLRALDDLVHQGKVLYLGCSNYAAYRMVESVMLSERDRMHRFVSLQAQYSLLERAIEREHVPACDEFGLGILPWSPLAGGFLSGKYRRNQPPPKGSRLDKRHERYARFDTERNWRILDAVLEVGAKVDASPSQVSLAWLLKKRNVTSLIFGARSVEQLEDNLRAAQVDLDADSMKRLDDASAFDPGYPYSMIAGIQQRW